VYRLFVGEKATGFALIMSLENIFGYISRKLDGFGQNLVEGWAMGKE